VKNTISVKWSFVLLILVLALLASACESDEEAATPTKEPTQAPAAKEPCTVYIFSPWELSGAGATVGNNNKDAVTLAVEEINAAGGLLGCQVEVEFADTQSDPTTSKALIAKGLEGDPYVILGPAYSGSIIVNMVEA
jgi:ABC-type branched-subunit amino acid transport system substrate-binding protein